MSYPKISIVTPNFNGDRYIEETILSVLGQGYPNLEYIIIDGGSTDNSVDIIKKYQKYLTYWVSEPDNGMYQAIQKGFDRSTGEIMAWINSDDLYHKNAFFTIAEIFKAFSDVNWIVGASTIIDELSRTVIVGQSRQFSKYDFYNLDFKWIQQESVFWRRSLWDKVGGSLNTTLKYAGDFDLWIKFFQYEVLFVTHALIGGFRFRKANQLSLDHIEEYLQEAELLINEIKLTKNEKKVLLNYKRLLKFIYILGRFKFIKTDWIIQKYRSRHFGKSNLIKFDRDKMKFVLSSALTN